MAMVVLDYSSLSQSPSWVAWSEGIGDFLALFCTHQMNQLNSRNGSTTVTAS